MTALSTSLVHVELNAMSLVEIDATTSCDCPSHDGALWQT